MLAILLAVIQLLILTKALSPASHSAIGILSATTSFLAYIGLCPLLLLEHTRAIRPADYAVIYLLITLACDTAGFGTAILENAAFLHVALPLRAALLAIANICVKFVLLVIESQGKQAILRSDRGQWSPEELAGILSRTFFWWINPILAQGRRDILAEDSLPPLDLKISSGKLRHKALLAWDQRGRFFHGSRSRFMVCKSCLTDVQLSRATRQHCQRFWSQACCRPFSRRSSLAYLSLSFGTPNQS